MSESDRKQSEDEPTAEASERLEDMRDQVQFLRGELERKDTIIMALTQRVPQLEPARDIAADEAHEETERPPWWVRLFGGN